MSGGFRAHRTAPKHGASSPAAIASAVPAAVGGNRTRTPAFMHRAPRHHQRQTQQPHGRTARSSNGAPSLNECLVPPPRHDERHRHGKGPASVHAGRAEPSVACDVDRATLARRARRRATSRDGRHAHRAPPSPRAARRAPSAARAARPPSRPTHIVGTFGGRRANLKRSAPSRPRARARGRRRTQ